MLKRYLITLFIALLCSFGTSAQPLSVSFSPSSSDSVDCDCNAGYLKAIGSGGTGPYTYLWSTGATTDEIYSLFAGTYTVTVTDAMAATVTSSHNISNSSTFWSYVYYIAPTPGECNGFFHFETFCVPPFF